MARLPAVFAVAVLAIAASFVPLYAQHTFNASAIEGQGTIADGLANVSFKIQVRNHASSPMSNVVVVFADNTEVTVGDVAGEGTVTTDTQNRTIDVSEAAGTRTVVMHVTVKYAVDGENVEAPGILSVVAE